ncbi:MAG: hypothetical protein AAF447_16850 [Myxococcota bacterium]
MTPRRSAATAIALGAFALTLGLVLRAPIVVDGLGATGARAPLLVLVEGAAPGALARRAEAWLGARSDVAWTLSTATRPWLSAEGTPATVPSRDASATLRLRHGPRPSVVPDPLDRFLAPGAEARVVLAGLAPGATWTSRDEASLRALARGDPSGAITVLGVPSLRLATAALTRADLRRELPFLVLVSLLLPAWIFGALRAALFPLAVAAVSSAGTLLAMLAVDGALDPLAIAIVPTVWSIATLDAVHLYGRTAQLGDARRAARALGAPCLVTSATTVAGLLALGFGGALETVSALGRWGAFGTALAYVLTFGLGPALLRLAPPAARVGGGAEACFRRVLVGSQRRWPLVLVTWALGLGAAADAAADLAPDVAYPDVYVAGTEPAEALSRARAVLAIDPTPLHLELRARAGEDRTPRTLAGVATVLQQALDGDPRVALGLGAGLALRDLARREGVDRVHAVQEGAADDLAPWWDAEHGRLRVVVMPRPMDYAQRRGLVADLEALLAERFPGFEANIDGVSVRLLLATEDVVAGTLRALLVTLAVALVAFGVVFRRRPLRLIAVVLAVNLAPLIALAGLAGGPLGAPFTVGVASVATLVLALSVDDTVHLLWAARDPRVPFTVALARGAGRAGAPVLLTTALLAGNLAVLALGSFVLHQRLAVLVPLGVVLAWLADATLLPALLRAVARRRERGDSLSAGG